MKPCHSFVASFGAACALALSLAACNRTAALPGDAPGTPPMKPSVTYLHLLRHTPFFTRLDTDQLRWTIDHSHEWEAKPGTVIASCDARGAATDDTLWILLDGQWRVEENGRSHPAGHADPGKWFSAAEARGPCRLVATGHSYVMQIARRDMDEMLKRGFAFDAHPREGRAYYEAMFGNRAAP